MSTSTLLLQVLFSIALLLPYARATILLAQFQQITDFTQPCMDAYNAPINRCEPSDFPNSCSTQCLAALSATQNSIVVACSGEAADPGTVIGHFFSGTGPQFLCSGDFGQGQGQSSSSTSSTESASFFFSSTTTVTSSTESTFTTTTSASKSSRSTPSPSSTSSESFSTTSTSKFKSLSPASSSTTTSSYSSSTKAPGSPTFLSTAVDNGSATVLTSTPERTGSSNPDAFGGGGSPFEVGANAAAGAGAFETDRWAWTIVCLLTVGIFNLLW